MQGKIIGPQFLNPSNQKLEMITSMSLTNLWIILRYITFEGASFILSPAWEPAAVTGQLAVIFQHGNTLMANMMMDTDWVFMGTGHLVQ